MRGEIVLVHQQLPAQVATANVHLVVHRAMQVVHCRVVKDDATKVASVHVIAGHKMTQEVLSSEVDEGHAVVGPNEGGQHAVGGRVGRRGGVAGGGGPSDTRGLGGELGRGISRVVADRRQLACEATGRRSSTDSEKGLFQKHAGNAGVQAGDVTQADVTDVITVRPCGHPDHSPHCRLLGGQLQLPRVRAALSAFPRRRARVFLGFRLLRRSGPELPHKGGLASTLRGGGLGGGALGMAGRWGGGPRQRLPARRFAVVVVELRHAGAAPLLLPLLPHYLLLHLLLLAVLPLLRRLLFAHVKPGKHSHPGGHPLRGRRR